MQKIVERAPCQAALSLNPLYLAIVTHPDESLESNDALLDIFMEELPNVIRFYLVRGKDVTYRERSKKISLILNDRPAHPLIISDDDITNLKISLENARTVDDLIYSL